jgi:hypothetical protein
MFVTTPASEPLLVCPELPLFEPDPEPEPEVEFEVPLFAEQVGKYKHKTHCNKGKIYNQLVRDQKSYYSFQCKHRLVGDSDT